MTFLDAARFLIACAATDHPEQAADAEYQFSNAVFSHGLDGTSFHLDATIAPTLDIGLARLLGAIADGTIDEAHHAKGSPFAPMLSLLVFRGGVNANIRVQGSEYHFSHPTLSAVVSAPDYLSQKPLSEAYERETYRFRNGKNLIAELNATLLRAVANLIAGNAREPASPS
ncbi:hypothetical protein AE618_12395 [Bosea vaviloviae]|uniref:Uncharacterized protein n=2 Tax=Bosea vaviloviae TaxID=1526658 RepID=A0A0N1FHT9_9HYPH|nr:hypothetical protein AE618_12395 [Bosea vaviloviae]